ncbi:phenylacetic acid degradation protein PaaC [Amycolatopsis mediterranei S699]|uniref:Phenylacetic acid degradation protein PaaC n=2 Tax=Amycolatopsis mediterranei TaxID=33910 RepID=A0A0H3CZL8_AMYMU|nr:1,2-phenylacetyl-CoA epoxidase subunit PaaC [Amycolatopsis mediterranei]ADJ43379.1 phenylacetic acid degradation protein PaaC [Amycolatopsis mediterranei U32]AEK40081.1 phenylacetic acid degradation protein PaaC [Amycolatopsis mediterranei S699]AFO75092.1 phenylacetic acid degradation protein PaaC [Amycolatopsis mediterranei S699]AGT82221.1 phenylacetic acid degradation protein PaaC [Amycolatopsis mediterranei RB]KDO11716.1 phenylacetate-CoA oxygenase [Amycolatopsis mediterranei]
MSFDNVYEAITEENDARWAFGTGFEDPLSGVDTSVPSGVDGVQLAAYCLMLGDDALVFSHRLQEWCTNAPELEDEVAIANIALDLLGQARLLLARAGKADGSSRTEDSFAFLRAENEFRNVRLAELGGGHFGHLIARLFVFSTWRLALFQRLETSVDPVLAAIADKGVKELAYHRDYAAQWLVRLGDGTPLSHSRMQEGLDEVWPYVGELFRTHPTEFVDAASLRPEFDAVLDQVLAASTLSRPSSGELAGVSGRTGRDGVHTEQMGFLLAELQSVARAMPDARW